MKKKQWIMLGCGLAVAAAGGILMLQSRPSALGDASSGSKVLFVLSLIGCILGVLCAVAAVLPKAKPTNVKTLSLAAMFAALCYVGFAFFQIKIPVGDSSTSFHLGNVFCVLASLCIGGLWGGLAGAVGMTIGDLFDPVYITSAPKTFLLKLCIGLITGLVAHIVFRLNENKPRKLPLVAATALSCCAGMVFNIVADPLVGYFYKMYILGIPQDAATILAKIGAITTSVNALIAVVAATVFYMALRPALKKSHILYQK